jgi:hypothetical protein
MVRAWLNAGMDLESWRALEPALHKAGAELLEGVFHETNAWLVEQACCRRWTCGPSFGARKAPPPVPCPGRCRQPAGRGEHRFTGRTVGDFRPVAPPGATQGMVPPLGANIARMMPESLRGRRGPPRGRCPPVAEGPA